MRIIISLVLCLLLAVFANGHGYVNQPIASRQYKCSKSGNMWYPADGTGIPDLACRAGFQYVAAKGNNPQYQLVQVNEYSMNIPNYAAGYSALVSAIPSAICSAGQTTAGNDKSGMSIAANWTPTTLTADAGATSKNITLSWCATATHNPSYWEFYVSKPSYNPSTAPLTWNDLELLQTYPDTASSTTTDSACSASKAYFFNINLPVRTSPSVLVTRWQRIDPVGECFMSCSDYVFN